MLLPVSGKKYPRVIVVSGTSIEKERRNARIDTVAAFSVIGIPRDATKYRNIQTPSFHLF